MGAVVVLKYLGGLLALTPIACVVGFVDGPPMIAVTARFSKEHGFQVGCLDVTIATLRRIALAACAAVGLAAALVAASSTDGAGEEAPIALADLVIAKDALGGATAQWTLQGRLLLVLLILDLLAAPRAWRLTGYAPSRERDMLMWIGFGASTVAGWARAAYAELARLVGGADADQGTSHPSPAAPMRSAPPVLRPFPIALRSSRSRLSASPPAPPLPARNDGWARVLPCRRLREAGGRHVGATAREAAEGVKSRPIGATD